MEVGNPIFPAIGKAREMELGAPPYSRGDARTPRLADVGHPQHMLSKVHFVDHSHLGPPARCPFSPTFSGEGSTKIDVQTKVGTSLF